MSTIEHQLCNKSEQESDNNDENPLEISTLNYDKLNSARNYRAHSDDVFIITYPKCGTTWMQTIVYGLQNQGRSFDDDINDFMARTPFLDMLGAEDISAMRRPGTIKTHMSFIQVPKHPEAKYIIVIRHPKDVCVSYYHFDCAECGLSDKPYNFDEYLDKFLAGNLLWWCSYFDFLRAVWVHRNDKNVLLVSYEQMKTDLTPIIRKIACFLDIECTNELLAQVLKHSSFEYMRAHYDKAIERFYAQPAIVIAQAIGEPFAALKIQSEKVNQVRPNRRVVMVREGKIGSWKSYLTKEQICRLDETIEKETHDLDGIDSFWNISNTTT